MNLRVPGPTPCPDPVREALGGEMINHRGPEFAELIRALNEGLKPVFQTRNDVLVLTCSGTGGLEAIVTNTLSPGERAMVVSIGVFGQRVAQIAEAFGADVLRLDFEMGRAADPDVVRRALQDEPKVNTVFITHNETSTGVTNDLEALAKVVKGEFGKTLVVDGISSIGSIPCPMDEWEIDLAVSGSQKGWMTPPGLAMVAVSQRGWEAVSRARMPRTYLDLTLAKNALARGQTPWTPAISTMYGLRKGIEMLLDGGLDAVFKRHAGYGELTRRLVREAGLDLFADPAHASNTVTSIKMPANVEWRELSSILRERHGVVLAGGQGPLTGKVFRIGHLGWLTEEHIEEAVSALTQALGEVNASPSLAAGSA